MFPIKNHNKQKNVFIIREKDYEIIRGRSEESTENFSLIFIT